MAPEELPDLETGQLQQHQGPAFEERYPTLARWVMGGGWVELGRTDYSRSLARALDEGGMVWESKDHYKNMDELLRDLNEGIGRGMERNP